MICKNKIGNLHTSYKKIGEDFLLSAYFGVNVLCAMHEILKFPNLFKLEDLEIYLDRVSIVPKLKGPSFSNRATHFFEDFSSEDKEIVPKIVKISNATTGIFYFNFEQLFKPRQKRKYFVRFDIKDFSITKAVELKEKLLTLNDKFERIRNDDEITEEIIDEIVLLCQMSEQIQKKENMIFTSVIKTRTVDKKILSKISLAVKKEINYINQKLNYGLEHPSPETNLRMDPKNTGLVVFKTFTKEFKQQVYFNFKKEFKKERMEENIVNYSLINEMFFKQVESLPSFDTSYSKRHLFQQKQSLKIKAPNYNLDFVKNYEAEDKTKKNDFIIKKAKEQIYVLNGHNDDNVTAEIFTPLADLKFISAPGSSYLCKTNMVESEEQYFILEK